MKLISSSIYASIDVVLKSADNSQSVTYDIRSLPDKKRRKIQILKDDSPLALIEMHTLKEDVFTLRDTAVAIDRS